VQQQTQGFDQLCCAGRSRTSEEVLFSHLSAPSQGNRETTENKYMLFELIQQWLKPVQYLTLPVPLHVLHGSGFTPEGNPVPPADKRQKSQQKDAADDWFSAIHGPKNIIALYPAEEAREQYKYPSACIFVQKHKSLITDHVHYPLEHPSYNRNSLCRGFPVKLNRLPRHWFKQLSVSVGSRFRGLSSPTYRCTDLDLEKLSSW
jgi:hypothetical protein